MNINTVTNEKIYKFSLRKIDELVDGIISFEIIFESNEFSPNAANHFLIRRNSKSMPLDLAIDRKTNSIKYFQIILDNTVDQDNIPDYQVDKSAEGILFDTNNLFSDNIYKDVFTDYSIKLSQKERKLYVLGLSGGELDKIISLESIDIFINIESQLMGVIVNNLEDKEIELILKAKER